MIVGEFDNATAAMEVVDFPLLEHDPAEEYVSITNQPHGREGLLPADIFTPTLYNLEDPKRVRRQVADTWIRNVHVGAVFEKHLGRGRSFGGDILGEMLLTATHTHKATRAVTAARILIETETDPAATFAAVWDDGHPYESPGEIEQRFSKAAITRMYEEPDFQMREADIAPTVLYSTVVDAMRGQLTVVSGETRTDITKEGNDVTYEHTTVPGIVGNLVVARLPHVS